MREFTTNRAKSCAAVWQGKTKLRTVREASTRVAVHAAKLAVARGQRRRATRQSPGTRRAAEYRRLLRLHEHDSPPERAGPLSASPPMCSIVLAGLTTTIPVLEDHPLQGAGIQTSRHNFPGQLSDQISRAP